MKIEHIWYGKGIGPLIGRLLLLPLSVIYAIGWELYLLSYRVGVKKAAAPHRNIICIGNLTAGGSGKTPVVVLIASLLAKKGNQVVFGCSGYGSPRSEGARIAPPGQLSPKEWGDEPAELRELAPEVPIIVGRRRVLAAELCAENFPDAVLLMDDGFQHLPLKKLVSILLDSSQPVNALPFPAGPYREPRWNRKRATLVLPGERFKLSYSNMEFWNPRTKTTESPEEAYLLSAIGRPDLFEASVASADVRVLSHDKKADHDPLDAPDLFKRHNSSVLIVTMKDWVKLRERSDVSSQNILVARRSARIEPQNALDDWLKEELR